MKTVITAIMLLSAAGIAQAGNAGYLMNTRLIVQTEMGEQEERSSQDPYGLNRLKKWAVKKEGDPVANAVEVYKSRKNSASENRMRIIDRSNPNRTVLVDYGGGNDKMLFTPDEDFAYFVGLNGGTTGIFGVNLSTQDKFLLSPGSDFFMETCPNNRHSYVVVKNDGKGTDYTVYDVYGKKFKDLSDITSPETLKQFVCY